MTVKEDTLRERLIRRIEQLNVSKLEVLEAQLDELTKPTPEEIERRLAAWRGVVGMLSDPEEYAEWEASARRMKGDGRERDLGRGLWGDI